MTDTAGRSFVVGVPGELSDDERRQLNASEVQWKGRYEVLRAGWQVDGDTTPWATRHVLNVQAEDPGAAVKRVTDVLGRPASLDAT